MSGVPPNPSPSQTQPPATSGGQPQPPRTSGLAIAALVLSILPCVNLVGIILGIVALAIMSGKPELKGKGLAIAAIIIGVLWFFISILAAIAIPNFIKFQSRAKQSEAKVSLKSLYVAEKAYFADNNRYAPTFVAAGWQPEASRRYTYFLGDDVIAPTIGETQGLPDEVDSYVGEDGFQAAAIANLDDDDTVDVWVINDANALNQLSDDTTD